MGSVRVFTGRHGCSEIPKSVTLERVRASVALWAREPSGERQHTGPIIRSGALGTKQSRGRRVPSPGAPRPPRGQVIRPAQRWQLTGECTLGQPRLP